MPLNIAVNILPIAPQTAVIHFQIGEHMYLPIQLNILIIPLPIFLQKPPMMLQSGAQIYFLMQEQHLEMHLPIGTNIEFQIHLMDRPMNLQHGY
jgi:hypothetical protein